MDGPNTIAKTLLKNFYLTAFCLIAGFSSAYCQLDTEHYIPPVYARSYLGDYYLTLGTTIDESFNVTVTDGAGNFISSIPISSGASVSELIGSGLTSPFVIGEGDLNTPLEERGLILTADEPFYASVRVIASDQNQAGSLTSKGGKAARGRHFRTGHTLNNGGNFTANERSNTFSFMAIEDNTTVQITDIKQGVIFRGTVSSGTPLTSEDITITLNAGESYVMATYHDEPGSTNNYNGANGTQILSDKDIVVNCGTWTGGNPIVGQDPNGPEYGGRDIGIDQFVPVSKVGTEYVLIKGLGADNERTFVIATEDDTDIFLDGDPTEVAQIDAGDYYVITNIPYSAEDNLYLESSAPVYVVQTINGGPASGNPGVGGEMDNEDKNGMAIVPPLDCNGSRLVEVPDANFVGEFDPYGEAFINIVAPTGLPVEVDGVELTDPQPIIGTTEYVTYQVQGYEGDVIITADEPVLVSLITAGLNLGASGYFSGFTREFELLANYQGNILTASGEAYEGCGIMEITIERSPLDQATEQTVYLDTSGDAVEGLDYSPLADEMVFEVGETEITFTIFIYDDDLVEGPESIIIDAYLESESCASDQFAIIINDVEELEVDLGGDTTVCVGANVELNAAIFGGVEPYTYEWSNGEESESITVQPGTTTNYILTVTDACEEAINVGVDSLLVSVQEQVTVDLPEDTTICLGESITLTATSNVDGASFVWQPGGLVGSEITVSPTSTQLYTAIATSPQAGCNSAPQSVFVYVESGPSIEVSGNDSICPGEVTVLTASSDYDFEYTWDPGKLTGDSIVVSPDETTTYVVTGINQSGCNGLGEFTVVVDGPLVEIEGDNELCLGDSTTLSASSIFTDLEYTWYPGEIEGEEITVSPEETTIYTVVGFAEAGCNIEETISVTVNPLPEVEIAGENSICEGESSTLMAVSSSPQMSYEWNEGEFEGSEIVVSPDGTTEFEVIGFNGECYSLPEIFTLVVNDYPEVYPPSDTIICAGSSATVSAGSNQSGAEFYWEPQQTTGNPISLTTEESSIYTVVAIVSGCASEPATFLVDVYESCNCDFELPNIITPNGDNRNELLERIGGEECQFTNYELKVFNRWGNVIWETTNPNEFWDGEKNGEDVSDGIYYWSLNYTHIGSDEEDGKSGYVTITR